MMYACRDARDSMDAVSRSVRARLTREIHFRRLVLDSSGGGDVFFFEGYFSVCSLGSLSCGHGEARLSCNLEKTSRIEEVTGIASYKFYLRIVDLLHAHGGDDPQKTTSANTKNRNGTNCAGSSPGKLP
jgi:hypothetical protein